MKQVHNRSVRLILIGVMVLGCAVSAQTPQPFPRPNSQKPAQPPPTTTAAPPAPAPSTTAPKAPAPQAPVRAANDGEPTEAVLGAPIYPSAVYLTSYDA